MGDDETLDKLGSNEDGETSIPVEFTGHNGEIHEEVKRKNK